MGVITGMLAFLDKLLNGETETWKYENWAEGLTKSEVCCLVDMEQQIDRELEDTPWFDNQYDEWTLVAIPVELWNDRMYEGLKKLFRNRNINLIRDFGSASNALLFRLRKWKDG